MSASLLAKMFLDRRRFRGATEFAFTWRPARKGWQRLSIAARDTPFCADLHLRAGTSDIKAFEQIFCSNDYNLRRLARWKDILRIYRNFTREGTPLILDLGGNVGLASVYFAKNFPDARILAVEPSQKNYDVLRRNVSGLENITTLRAAVAAVDGFVNIVNPEDEAWAYRTELTEDSAAGVIPAKSVESLIASMDRDQANLPFICKIDIEGFESNLFSINTDWVRRFPLIIIELHDWMLPGQRNSRTFLSEISQHNRDFVTDGQNVFSISNEY